MIFRNDAYNNKSRFTLKMQREPFFNLKISDIIKKIINFSKNDIPNSISVVLYNDWVSQSKKHRRKL